MRDRSMLMEGSFKVLKVLCLMGRLFYSSLAVSKGKLVNRIERKIEASYLSFKTTDHPVRVLCSVYQELISRVLAPIILPKIGSKLETYKVLELS